MTRREQAGRRRFLMGAGACLLPAGLGLRPLVARAAAGTLVLNHASFSPPYHTPEKQGFLDRLMPEIGRRLGTDIRFEFYVGSERGLINANAGIDDGVVMRTAGLERQYPDLLRVPEKLIDNDFVAFSREVDLAVERWEALKPHVVGYIIGWKLVESNLPRLGQTLAVKDIGQLFDMLAARRIDVAIHERWQGLSHAKARGLDVRVLEPPVLRAEMFVYLHRRHAAVIPGFAAALAETRRDGTYDRIREQTLGVLQSRIPGN